LVFEFVSGVEVESVPVVVPAVVPPVVTSMLSIVMAAIAMSDVVPEVVGVFESLPSWFVAPVVLDEPEAYVDPVLAVLVPVVLVPVVLVPVVLVPVVLVPVVLVPVLPEVVEAPVVLPSNAWSTF
jgi:hypothetical protein